MSRLDPQVLTWAVLATLVVVLIDLAGLLDGWKERIHDLEQRHLPRQVDSMSPAIVLIDIDDRALERLGRWPWPRTDLADAISALALAGARTIALDVDLADPQDSTVCPQGLVHDHDGRLAVAIDEHVVMAVLLMPDELDARWAAAGGSPVDLQAAIDAIEKDPSVDPRTLEGVLSDAGRQAAAETLHLLRRRAMERLVLRGVSSAQIELLAGGQWGALRSTVEAAANRHDARALLPGLARGGTDGPPSPGDRFPYPSFVEDAGGAGYVNIVLRGTDGGIRRLIPLLDAGHDGRILPLGIAAALHFLGHAPESARVEDEQFMFVDRIMPMREGAVTVSWPRGPHGLDWPDIHRDGDEGRFAGHLSIAEVVLLGRARRNLAIHDEEIRRATADLLRGLRDDPDMQARDWLAPELQSEVADEVEFTLGEITAPEDIDTQLSDADDATRTMLLRMLDWKRHVAAAADLRAKAQQVEQTLAEKVSDKLVFIGWTATGTAADFVPSAAGPRTPGVMIHAAMADMILQRRVLKEFPPWWSAAMALLLGLLVALLVGRLGPWPATIASALALAAWIGLVLTLYWSSALVLPVAAPLFAATLTWGAGTGSRAVLVQQEKRRVTRQFRARVPAVLVDELAGNPDAVSMAGVSREVCVMFGDLAGFTAISEQLGSEETIAVLNMAMSGLTERLTARGAYLNKFLGDGFLAFWSAFGDQPDQAHLADQAARECQAFMVGLNAELPDDAPAMGLRIGIATGEAIVGDCGAPPHLNDYTVIGDVANLASRLESANKQIGTCVLLDGRTCELLGDASKNLFAIGPLKVVGRESVVEAWGRFADSPSPGMLDASRVLASSIAAGDRAAARAAMAELGDAPAPWMRLVRAVVDAPDPMPTCIELTDK